MVVDLLNVLVMTPVRSFGELLQQALQETDLYRVTLVQEKRQVLASLRNGVFPVVVLDLDLEPNPAVLLRAVDEAAPDVRLIVLRNYANNSELLAGCRVTRLLESTFYLPDLFEALDEVAADVKASMAAQSASNPGTILSINQPAPTRTGTVSPTWSRVVEAAACDLSRLSLGDQIQAAVILSNNQLQAYSGHLPELAGEELARFARHYWTPRNNSDLARYIRLEATGEEYLLYITTLTDGTILGLVFMEEIPFSTIRSQVNALVSRLSVTLEESRELVSGSNLVQDLGLSSQGNQSSIPVHSSPVVIQNPATPESDAHWDPSKTRVEPFWEEAGSDFEADTRPVKLSIRLEETSPEPANPAAPPDFFDPWVPDSFKNTLPVAVPDYLQDTIPSPTGPIAAPEPVSTVMVTQQTVVHSDLHPFTYAFVLVPRHPQHLLVGELAAFLSHAFIEFGVTFGWKLVQLAIRPEYLHWVAAIPATASPGSIAWQIRDQSAQQILERFPVLAQQASVEDFWTREYLVVNGRDPLPQKMVTDFVTRARHHG